MSEADGRPSDPDRADGDLEDETHLLDAVRAGSAAAFSVLYDRHRSSALRYARRLLSDDRGADPEDVVELAFVRSFSALRNGRGPGDTLRYYLLASIRHEVWRVQRRRRREALALDRWAVDEGTKVGRDEALAEGTVEGLSPHVLMAGVFRDLPERWRNVLWLTEVEGREPSEVAPMLGMTPNSVSALAYRARHGLRVAFIGAYQDDDASEACQTIAPRLAQYLASRNRAAGEFDDVRGHLGGCESCRNLVRGVDAPDATLRAAAPLGLLTAGWWATSSAGIGPGGAVAAAGRAAARFGRVSRHPPAWLRPVIVVTVAAMGVAAILVAATRHRGDEDRASPQVAERPDGVVVRDVRTEAPLPEPTHRGSAAAPTSTTAPPAPGAAGTGAVAGQVLVGRALERGGVGGVPILLRGRPSHVVHHSVTSVDGTWSARGLAPGTYRLVATIPVGFSPTATRIDRSGPSTRWDLELGTVEVRAGHTTEVTTDLTARRGLNLSGGAATATVVAPGERVGWRFRLASAPASVGGARVRITLHHPGVDLRDLVVDGLTGCSVSTRAPERTVLGCLAASVTADGSVFEVRAVIVDPGSGSIDVEVTAEADAVRGDAVRGDRVEVARS